MIKMVEGWPGTRRKHAHQPWDYTGRASCDQIRDPIKTVEVDTSRPYSCATPTSHKSQNAFSHQQQEVRSAHSHNFVSSPAHRAQNNNFYSQAPPTPSPTISKPRNLQIHSAASPRCINRAERERDTPTILMPQTPTSSAATPNYMAATESAKARLRSQSAPKHRPSTPEREKTGTSARKRLSFPANPDPYGGSAASNGYGSDITSRSPSYKSIIVNHNGVLKGGGGGLVMEQRTSISSCCTDSEISPPRTSDLGRWLRSKQRT